MFLDLCKNVCAVEREKGPQHVARVLPGSRDLGKDSVSKERSEGRFTCTKTVRCLDISYGYADRCYNRPFEPGKRSQTIRSLQEKCVDRMDSRLSGSTVLILLTPRTYCSKVEPVLSKIWTNHCRVCFSAVIRNASMSMSNASGHLYCSRLGVPQPRTRSN